MLVGQESRAADHVERAVGVHGRLEPIELARIVLAVTVDLDHPLVSVLQRVGEARLDRAADPEVERHPDDMRALATPHSRRCRRSTRRR